MKNSQAQDWMLFLKMGERDHLQMLREGKLYMNTMRYFAELENDGARADPFEGTDSIIQPKDVGEFIFNPNIPGMEPISIPNGDLAGAVRFSLDRIARCNLFCIFAVTAPIDGPVFPPVHPWFGDSVLLFKNTQEFLNRVVRAAQQQSLRGEGKLVTYYDPNSFSGKTGPFMKPSQFAYQKEYRLLLDTDLDRSFIFDVGDLTDITSEVLPFAQADEIFKFGRADAHEAGLTW